ncbi:MAG: amidohydrolase [Maricaulis sp.]|jgi:predicted amidohydrolase|nr:amidohydrolase [Maricaulis sp.]HAQ36429.1 amidohydrolase [Alphaproteobacteria bacterium]
MSKLPVALVQMRSGTDPLTNIDDAARLVEQAVRGGAKLVVTPECSNIVERDAEKLFPKLFAPGEDPAVLGFADIARTHGVWLLAGSLAQKVGDNRAVNRSHLFAPDGSLAATYDKIHMFDVGLGGGETYSESTNYKPGSKAVIADAAGMKLGLTICYDVRFASLYRRLAQAGAQVIAVPSAFTRPTGRAHWEILLRARAIETGSYILAAAQGGHHDDGRNTWGRSMVVGPWGEIAGVLDHDEPGVLNVEIDLDAVADARTRIPSLRHDREVTGP